ncbi:cell division protein ZapA [Alkalibaculum sp. M08DMB]|uniref:Cell division protein ZapA n=1 Tax=Alkalibaculum sporogenes TaxID=2655001 RepID=A0A6A7KA78_9FIRM|nr:cell division protein ZapA [Alkalibaculum sporogenes]MPW26296.1 cell division protein ZapA [Alkalibaculum sporogenes]
MENKSKVVAKIQDVEYTLLGTIDQKHIDEISKMVDDMMSIVKKSNPLMNRSMVLILSCINFCDEIIKLNSRNEKLEQKLESIEDVNDLKEQLTTYKEYNKQNNDVNSEMKKERDTLKKELIKSKDLIEQYNKKNRQYKFDIEESRKTILDLQNQLFESQIELVKANKQ